MVGNYKINNEEFLKELSIKRPNIEALEKYHGVDGKIRCKCRICDYEFETTPYVLLSSNKGNGCRKCNGTVTKTHEEYIQEIKEKSLNIIPIEKYQTCHKNILHKCLICNYEWSARPANILNGKGCPACNGKKINIGFNDLWTTHPHIAELLENPDDGYKVTYGSGKKFVFKCPNCGELRTSAVNMVVRNGFSCKRCSDGISYPMKFTMCLLEQLKMTFDTEQRFDWCTFYNPYKRIDTYGIYDITFEHKNIKYILEVDGYFHYKTNTMSNQSEEESKYIDAEKDKLAMLNGYKVIRIDAMESNLEYMKNSILSSQLNDIFDLSVINWIDCAKSSLSSLIIECANLWKVYRNANKISKIINKRQEIVTRYLNKATKLGLCDYDGKLELQKSGIRLNQRRKNKAS